MMAQGMDERVGSKDQDVQGKIFLGPKALAKGTQTGPRVRGGSSLFSGATPFWVSPCIPHTCLPLEPTYVSPTLLPNSTGVLVDPMPVTGGRLEGPGEGQGPLIPAHLLVQIVVKQDQVEVPLQALQGPLPDALLAAAALRGGDRREVGEVKMGLLRPHNPTPSKCIASPLSPRPSPACAWDPPYKKAKRPT